MPYTHVHKVCAPECYLALGCRAVPASCWHVAQLVQMLCLVENGDGLAAVGFEPASCGGLNLQVLHLLHPAQHHLTRYGRVPHRAPLSHCNTGTS
jgi:hypothetical protein